MPPALTVAQEQLLRAIAQAVAANNNNPVWASKIAGPLGRYPTRDELRELYMTGRVEMVPGNNQGAPYTRWKPRAQAIAVHPGTRDALRTHLAEVFAAVKKPQYPTALYVNVRNHFLWFDDGGNDQLLPLLQQLAKEGLCALQKSRDGELDLIRMPEPAGASAAPQNEPPREEKEDPPDEDFRLLNALEDQERKEINFGAYETARDVAEIARLAGRPAGEVAPAVGRLLQHRYLTPVAEARYRSRMAEMARLVRYLKQRFGPEDAGQRPFLARSIQVRILGRKKPARDQRLTPVVDELKQALAAVPHAGRVLDGLVAMLARVWGKPEVGMAAFQLRALRELLAAYVGLGSHDTFAITADTGSGKTEASVLPLMVGAAVDRLAGRRGVKAVLVYPRIRLAYNQAERLVKYLAALAKVDAGLLLTVGLQTKDVAEYFTSPYTAELWKWNAGENAYEFPLFRCPACGKDLLLRPELGQAGVDRLDCPACGWQFAGWVGTKQKVRTSPPDFFLPVTESLHQWQHDPRSGTLFGDHPNFCAPRALLADEVHLYSHIHGMQVGYALQRLLARAELNGGQRVLAIGMSATLSAASAVWGTLAGRPGRVKEIGPEEAECEDAPKGREYFYFIQPEIESRGQQIAGESTSIQALMCLAHNMRRRPGDRGGYRGLVFFDSIDSVKRLLSNYRDAEQSKHLAALRTNRYPPDPVTKQPRPSCCGKPAECTLFLQGECWYFAAGNDPYQVAASSAGEPVAYQAGQALRVMPRPVFSGNNERVEKQMGQNGLVFATSSLEVGFDDDEMILVYQHYAPLNLASFIQRKGRGGRSLDDRPVTGVTLSIYSPRDAWYFRHPDAMLAPSGFEVPLNPENFFVRRGQAVTLLLDFLARQYGRKKRSWDWPRKPTSADLAPMAKLLGEAPAEADAFLKRVLGPGVFDELKVKDAVALWGLAGAQAKPAADTWRAFLPWAPEKLYDAINLPMLTVKYPPESNSEGATKDIALLFGVCAPGNVTRRFGIEDAHWLTPSTDGLAPMLACHEDYAGADQLHLFTEQERKAFNNNETLLERTLRERLPEQVRARLGSRQLYHKLCRPALVTLQKAGKFERDGRWQPAFFWDAGKQALVAADELDGRQLPGIHHKSRATLLGFPLLTAAAGLGKEKPIAGLERLADHFTSHTGGAKSAVTGLNVARAFWGVEVRLRLDDRDEDDAVWSTVFSDPQGEQPMLHGYILETEGVRLTPRAEELDRFLDGQLVALKKDPIRDRWLHGQFFRFLLATGFASAGLSSYRSGPLADLLIAANDDEELGGRLRQLREQFDAQALGQLLQDTRGRRLAAHPLLSPTRVGQLAEQAREAAFAPVFTSALNAVSNPARFRGYLRSLVLHGLALSLHELFVLHGRGDERQAMVHARLPVQFGDDADDTLTVFEGGDHGDGTTRTFLRHAEEAFATWRRGELAECPYATDDALVEMVFERADRHDAWLRMDPDDPATLRSIAKELTGTTAVAEVHLQVLRRVFFQVETVGDENFRLYDLHAEMRRVRQALEAASGWNPGRGPRRPTAWELVSAGAQAAHEATGYPTLNRLLGAYRALVPGHAHDVPDAEARLTDQLYRVSSSLCPDGCLACLHRPSSLMPDAHAALAVSAIFCNGTASLCWSHSPWPSTRRFPIR